MGPDETMLLYKLAYEDQGFKSFAILATTLKFILLSFVKDCAILGFTVNFSYLVKVSRFD